MNNIKCIYCDQRLDNVVDYAKHLENKHNDLIIPDMTGLQFVYYLQTKRTHGTCIQCGKDTEWNECTGKYSRFCTDPECKDIYSKEMKRRMVAKYGKEHRLDEPDVQRDLLANRSISGTYLFQDGGRISYTGTYERDFLRFLDLILEFPSSDIMSPSPHQYYYIYEGKEHFYFPDFYIPSINLEIEIKDGGDNPNNHHKIQGVDKVKEKLKDKAVMTSKKTSYIKVVNKEHRAFLDILMKLKCKDNNILEYVIEQYNEDIFDYEDYYLSESCISEQLMSIEEYEPVYIVLSYTDSLMAKGIKYVTKQPFSHSGISFDSSLREIFTFGRKDGGSSLSFVIEDITSQKLGEKSDNIVYSLYVTFMDKYKVNKLKMKLNEILRDKTKHKYNYIGLVNYMLNRPSPENDKYFCSQFVASLLQEAEEGILKKDASLYSPSDLRKLRGFHFVNRGKAGNYNKYKTDIEVNMIKNMEGKGEII